MKKRIARNLPHITLLLAVLVMVVMGWTLYNATTDEIESSRWVSHTQDVLQTVSKINETSSRAEAAQRGYQISGAEVFLSERDQAFSKVNESVTRLKLLTADNPDQQRRMPQLQELTATRFAIMQDNARTRHDAGIEAGRFLGASGAGQSTSTEIYGLTAEIEREERTLLEARRIEAEQRHKTALIVILAAGLIGVIVLLPCYVGFVLQTRARRKAQVERDRFFNLSLDFLCVSGTDGYFKRINPAFSNALGYEPYELLARPFFDFIHPDDHAATLAELSILNEGTSSVDFEHRYLCKDGSWKWISWKTHPFTAEGIYYSTGRDITDRRQILHEITAAKDEAQRANRAKSTFLATMSHEIRTPMNGVLGLLELLGLTNLDPGQRTTLETVRDSGKSLLRIIDDILDFSKIEAGKLEVRPEVASIRDLVDGVQNIYSGNASSKGLQISRSTDTNISPAVMVDPLRVRQILNNFVSNAIKFTTKGSVEIRATLVERVDGEDRVRFSVTDTGIGISAEEQARLFEPFAQAERNSAQRIGGTGLGLTICRRLAGMMGGTVEMVSEPGKGTTMILNLSLPIARPQDLRQTDLGTERDSFATTTRMCRMAPGVAQAEAEGTLALLVDDHPTNRTLLMRQVDALGYAGESAENGVEALEMWKSGRFGIVITDCNMPLMDGYQLARSIRRLEAASGAKRTPIVACTANALGGEAEICFAAGMDDYLVKPVELSRLLKKFDLWLPIPKSPGARSVRQGSFPRREDPGADAGEVLDRTVLAGISGADTAVENEILRDFRRANDDDTDTLKSAVTQRNMPQVALAIHRIKGACRSVGATALARSCERIENACRTVDWTAVLDGMEAFLLEGTRLNDHLALLEGSTSAQSRN